MYSTHAEIRMQQRAISPKIIEVLLDFGDVEFHQGCEIFSLRKSLCKRLVSLKLISKSLLEKVTGVYVIMKGNRVITAGHRYRKFKKNRK